MAAAAVLLWHFSLAFPRDWLGRATTIFPVRIAFAGHAAVAVSEVFHRWIEVPSIAASKRAGRRGW